MTQTIFDLEKKSKFEIHKLNENSEFRRVYSRGKFISSYNLTTYCLKKRQQCRRIGVTTSKKIGCAVKRNRARRLIIEAYRKIHYKLDENCDIVFLARSKTCEDTMQSVLRSMIFQTKKLGLWN